MQAPATDVSDLAPADTSDTHPNKPLHEDVADYEMELSDSPSPGWWCFTPLHAAFLICNMSGDMGYVISVLAVFFLCVPLFAGGIIAGIIAAFVMVVAGLVVSSCYCSSVT